MCGPSLRLCTGRPVRDGRDIFGSASGTGTPGGLSAGALAGAGAAAGSGLRLRALRHAHRPARAARKNGAATCSPAVRNFRRRRAIGPVRLPEPFGAVPAKPRPLPPAALRPMALRRPSEGRWGPRPLPRRGSKRPPRREAPPPLPWAPRSRGSSLAPAVLRPPMPRRPAPPPSFGSRRPLRAPAPLVPRAREPGIKAPFSRCERPRPPPPSFGSRTPPALRAPEEPLPPSFGSRRPRPEPRPPPDVRPPPPNMRRERDCELRHLRPLPAGMPSLRRAQCPPAYKPTVPTPIPAAAATAGAAAASIAAPTPAVASAPVISATR